MMYTRILGLTEEIEAVIGTDDHVRLQDLMSRRAEAFSAMAGHEPQAAPEASMIIEKILECEKRCQEQALRKIEMLKKDIDGIRKGKRLEKAYGRFASTG